MKKRLASLVLACVTAGLALHAQQPGLVPAPDRRSGEGVGPFSTLTIRNVMVIDGTGAPPFGPANVIVENNRIARIVNAGTPGVPSREPAPAPAPNIIDGTGMFLMPGFVNLHAHLGDEKKAPQNEYVYKLYMAHGVTTIRGVELTAQPMALREKERSAKNEIVAPRIYNYQRPGAGWGKGVVDTPEKAREWVQWCAANGVDGMKLVAYPPHIMSALLDEAKKHGLGSTAHLEQRGVAQMDALTAAKMGLGTVTDFYGHFEPLLRDFRVQPWPEQMNYNDEQ
ncbi:MAG: amidohydrolase family protein, partial [Vicinamibacterales bacterium]